MSYPDKPSLDYSYTSFQQSQASNDFPGTELDNDLANLKTSVDEIIDAWTGSFNAEGILKPGKTADTEDFDEAVQEAQAAAADAASSASAAGVSADAAAASAAAADASAQAAAASAATLPLPASSSYIRGNDTGTAFESRTPTQVRQDIDLEIGVDVQAYSAILTNFAGVSTVADRLVYANGTNTFAATTFTAAGRALVDDADATAQRATLGLTIGTNVQAWDADLDAIAALVSAADRLPYATGAGTWSLATFTAAGRALVDDADATAQRTTLGLGTIATQNANGVAITGGSIAGITDLALADGGTGASTASAARTNLGVAIGTDVQAFNSNLTAFAGLTLAADTLPYGNGAGTMATTSFTSFARTLVGNTSAGTARNTLGAYASAGGDLSGVVTQSAGNGVVVGGTALTSGVYAGSAITPQVQVQAAGAVGFAAFRAGASASPPILGAYKTRGASASAHTAVNTSDQLFAFVAGGSDGTAYRDGFRLVATVTGAPTATNVPTRADIITGDGTSTFTGIGQDQNGNLQVNQQTVVTQARHFQLRNYTVATLPSAATAAQLIYVSDGTSNKRLAVSDGTNWRWPDGAIVS
jgi:hypothetical protein